VEGEALPAVEQAENLPGKGVMGLVDGVRHTLGNRQLAPCTADMDERVLGDHPAGATVVWLCREDTVLAAFALSDGLRPDAVDAVARLKAEGLDVTILSGDAHAAVAHAATQLGVEDFHWEQKPQDKLDALKRLQARGEVVAMVGDGINDAPVLAGSQVSLAMGGGTDVARASSDIILLTQRLGDVWHAVETGRDSIRIMRQNFAWAIGYNLVAVPIAVAGMVPPWLAALGMSVSSLVVVANALRLR